MKPTYHNFQTRIKGH